MEKAVAEPERPMCGDCPYYRNTGPLEVCVEHGLDVYSTSTCATHPKYDEYVEYLKEKK